MLEFIKMLGNIAVGGFDEGLWNATVETVTAQLAGSMVFMWRNGAEMAPNIFYSVTA
jgi:hypothetical protein